MNFIDQFIISVTFQTKKAIQFVDQHVWKSVFYVLMLVLIAGVVSSMVYPTVFPEETTAFRFFYHYMRIAIDLIVHFIFISALAFAGRSYGRLLDLKYLQIWTITAYGISAPIAARTVIQIANFNLPASMVIYWGAVAFFSIITLKQEWVQEQ